MEDRRWVEVSLEAAPEHAGLRVDSFLAARLRRCSRAEARRLIEEGRVSVRGRRAKPASRVISGQPVVVKFPSRIDPPAACAALEVLFEDDVLLVVNKPAGVLTQPTDKIKRNSVTAILAAQFPAVRLYTVHRLDRETSGALLLAKTRSAARALSVAFQARSIRKEYVAIVVGRVAFDWKLADAPLGREGGEICVRQSARPGGLEAVTEFERLAASDDRSLVRACPKTGRLHQIRAHLAWLGHPVLGDKIYQGDGSAYLKAAEGALTAADVEALGAPRQMLHAARLSFAHPMTGEELSIQAPAPRDFVERLPPGSSS
jgi:23S rRNA pseudouridine1911/1915/1917 synthase